MPKLPTLYKLTYNQPNSKGRLDKFLAINIPHLSRARIQKLIAAGAATINQLQTSDPSVTLKEGDLVILTVPEEQTFVLPTHRANLEIIYEDESLLVINKPQGLTVHPGAGNHTDTLVNILLATHKDALSTIGDAARPGIVHRLDKDTSGLMIIAKNNSTHSKLAHMLAERQIQRTYLALVYGMPEPHIGHIKTQYGRSKRDPKKMCVLRSGGKVAITNYKVIKNICEGTLSLIECTLQTGRTHQIRVHMEYLKHPIVGDKSYGRSLNFNLNPLTPIQIAALKSFPRQALHACKLEFVHPLTNELLQFRVDPPADIEELLSHLL